MSKWKYIGITGTYIEGIQEDKDMGYLLRRHKDLYKLVKLDKEEAEDIHEREKERLEAERLERRRKTIESDIQALKDELKGLR